MPKEGFPEEVFIQVFKSHGFNRWPCLSNQTTSYPWCQTPGCHLHFLLPLPNLVLHSESSWPCLREGFPACLNSHHWASLDISAVGAFCVGTVHVGCLWTDPRLGAQDILDTACGWWVLRVANSRDPATV